MDADKTPKQLLELLSGYSRNTLKVFTILIMVLFAWIFAYIFIFPLNLFQQLPSFSLVLPNIFQESTVILILTFFLMVWIFSNDPLYYADPRKNRYARAFKSHFPTNHIAEKFGIDIDNAKYYWFEKVFNPWSKPDHPRHQQWERTFLRGYQCRFIYSCIRLFFTLLVLSITFTIVFELLTTVFYVPMLETNIGIGWKILFIIIVGSLYILLELSNKTSPQNLTGVWRRFAEINHLNIQWVDENIHSLEDFNNL